jgi:hypothetical protein
MNPSSISWEGEYVLGEVPELNRNWDVPWNDPMTLYFAPSECGRKFLLEHALEIMALEGFASDDAIGLIRRSIGSTPRPFIEIEPQTSEEIWQRLSRGNMDYPPDALIAYGLKVNFTGSTAAIGKELNRFLKSERKRLGFRSYFRKRRTPENVAKEWVVYALTKVKWSPNKIDELLIFMGLPKIAANQKVDAKPAIRLLVYRVRQQIKDYVKYCAIFRPGFKVQAKHKNSSVIFV